MQGHQCHEPRLVWLVGRRKANCPCLRSPFKRVPTRPVSDYREEQLVLHSPTNHSNWSSVFRRLHVLSSARLPQSLPAQPCCEPLCAIGAPWRMVTQTCTTIKNLETEWHTIRNVATAVNYSGSPQSSGSIAPPDDFDIQWNYLRSLMHIVTQLSKSPKRTHATEWSYHAIRDRKENNVSTEGLTEAT